MPKSPCAVTVRARLKQANVLSRDPNATLKDLADTWGVSKVAASQYLRRHDAGLREHFGANKGMGNLFSSKDALWRLKFVKQYQERGASQKKIAELLGMKRSGLHMWLGRWAPDGVDAAIEDLED
jgi:predicted transcriptional regulator